MMGQSCGTRKGATEPAEAPGGEEPAAAPAGALAGASAALEALDLDDGSGAKCAYVSSRPLEPVRQGIVASAFPQCAAPSQVFAVIGSTPSGDTKEFIAVVDGQGAPSLVMGCCQITYEDLTPSECVEYRFEEDPSWTMAQLSLDALEHYRTMKFDAWKQMLLKPTCEAQFRRMLQLGVITRLFDPVVFPTPEAQKEKYKVVDEKTGKPIELPHPVSELRVWSASDGKYKEIDAHLAGAPAEGEAAAWWKGLLEQLRAEHGDEYISSLAPGA
ncbi:unnamed protein product [Prorocentrum cordatum]|uniref:Uncharacterized protein n=1 Tax=Prorocentrum cordatum TaxID=2364126 RepID=A0ABN9U711_9DINO|nr:unnamed protein product [Polarella glacialis]